MKEAIKKFFRVFFYCTSATFLNIAMQFAAAMLLMVLIMVLRVSRILVSGGTDLLSETDIESIAHSILLPSFILAAVLTFGTAWLAHVIFRKAFIKRLSINKTSFTMIISAFFIGCSLQMPVIFIMNLIQEAGVAPELFDKYIKTMEPLTQNQSILLQILAIGIVGPVLEEMIFRGLIFHQLKKSIPIFYAVIIQSAFFAMSHLNIIQGTYAFFIGILMALSLVWSRSLLLPIAIHIGMNLSGVLLSEYGDYIGNTTTYIILVLSFLVIIPGMAYLYFESKKRYSVTKTVF